MKIRKARGKSKFTVAGANRTDPFRLLHICIYLTMSWNLHAQSCCIKLAEVKSNAEFDALLGSLAVQIWEECIHDECIPDHFGCDDIPPNEVQGVPFILEGLKQYVTEFNCDREGASFIIYSEYDTQKCGDIELSERISEFFLLNSNIPFCLTQSSAFDKSGGYAHQWITFKDGDQVRSISSQSFIDSVLKTNNHSFSMIE